MAAGEQGLGYRAGLDGLRGISIVAVLLFHAELGVAQGGFLGVSTFYTLSGFLIAKLLLDEHREHGAINLSRFWLRRVRRLLPAALAGLLLATIAAAFIAEDAELARLRGDVVWALGYLLNWRLIFEDYSYGLLWSEPSPVQHFWSLAIEGQFYLVLPALLLIARRAPGKWGPALVVAALAACSALLAVWLTHVGAPSDRIYYGTDTRACELLVGCALALVLHASGRPSAAALSSVGVRSAGVIALGLTIASWVLMSLEVAWLYQGGLCLYALASAAIVASVLDESGPVGRWMRWRPIVALGRISYGVYVYHWPIYLLLSPERSGLGTEATLLLRLALTLGISWLSFHYFERPLRRAQALRWPSVAIGTAAGSALVLAVLLPMTAGKQALSFRDVEPTSVDLTSQPDALRLAFFGDSTMLTLSSGTGLWLREQGGLRVPGVTLNGCGLMQSGRFRMLEGEGRDVPGVCRRRPAAWRSALSANPIDIALVLMGTWDVLPRELLGDSEFRDLGDPVLDAAVRKDILAAVDLLSSKGATVVWLTCPHFARIENKPRRYHLYNDRVDRWNELIAEVAAMRPAQMRIVDLAGYVAAEPGRSVDTALRPDGVHWSVSGGKEVAQSWLGPRILAAYADREGRRIP